MLPKFEKILSITEETIILVMIISSLLFVFLNIVLRYLFSGGFVAAGGICPLYNGIARIYRHEPGHKK